MSTTEQPKTYQQWGTARLGEILVGDRAREDMGDINELAESLDGWMGQIQSLSVYVLPTPGPNGERYGLCSGGRRMAGFQHLLNTKGREFEIGIRIYPSELTIFQRKTIELMENKVRKDMTWAEEARLTREIHELHVAEYGSPTTLPPDKKSEGWTVEKTADFVGLKSRKAVHDHIKIAKALDDIPELAEASSAREAHNILAKLVEDMAVKELARRREKRDKSRMSNAESIRDEIASRYSVMDTFEFLESIPNNSIDLIDLDPDYGIDFKNIGVHNSSRSKLMEKFRKRDYIQTSSDENCFEVYLSMLFEECWRVLKPTGWLLVWHAQHPWANVVYEQLVSWNFQVKRIPGIWCKAENLESRPSANPNKELGHGYEAFYYASKPEAIIRQRARMDVFHWKAPLGNDTHPAEKPIDLMKQIFHTFALPGSEILIPFLGSGNGILAAEELQMTARGADASEIYKARFIQKLDKWVPPILAELCSKCRRPVCRGISSTIGDEKVMTCLGCARGDLKDGIGTAGI